MKMRVFLLSVVGIQLLSVGVFAADWPQWRGPQRDGISPETGLLTQWPSEGPQLNWMVDDIGFGYSTPAVAGDYLYVLSNEGEENEFVQALQVADGAHVWSTRVGKVGKPDQRPPYPGARSTPTIDGTLLYALGSDGDLACLDTATGKVRWQKSLSGQFGGQSGVWAYAESPLIDGHLVICTPGGSDATMAAFDKTTGELVWKARVPGGDDAAYASAIIAHLDGQKQYVQFVSKGVVGVDSQTGKFLWRYDKTAEGSPANIPTPLFRDGLVYSAAGRSGGGLVRLMSNRGTIDTEEIYFSAKLPTSIGGAVLVGEHLYGTNSQGLMCVEFATGEVKWQDRGVGAASLCYADGCLYLHGEAGEIALVEANPAAYVEKGRFTPPDQPERGRSRFWAYPVVANGRLYVREAESIWSFHIAAQ